MNTAREIISLLTKGEIQSIGNVIECIVEEDVFILTANKFFYKLIEYSYREYGKMDDSILELLESYYAHIALFNVELAKEQENLFYFSNSLNIFLAAIENMIFEKDISFQKEILNINKRIKDLAYETNQTTDPGLMHKLLGEMLDMRYYQNFFLAISFVKNKTIEMSEDKKRSGCKDFTLVDWYLAALAIFDKISFGEYKISDVVYVKESEIFKYKIEYRDKNFANNKYTNLRSYVFGTKKRDTVLDVFPWIEEEFRSISSIYNVSQKRIDSVLGKVLMPIDEKALINLIVHPKAQAVYIFFLTIYFFYLLGQSISKDRIEIIYFNMNWFYGYFEGNDLLTKQEMDDIIGLFFIDQNYNLASVFPKMKKCPIFKLSSTSFAIYGGISHLVLDEILSDFINSDIGKVMMGNDISQKRGNYFNTVIEKTFKDAGWTIVGTDIKIKEKGKIISDIDGAYVKNKDLFFIQAKSIASTIDIYNHFKASTKIKEAIIQSKKIRSYFEKENALLNFLKQKNIRNDIKNIYYIVVPNTHSFNYLEDDGILVLDIPHLNFIIKRDSINTLLSEQKAIFAKNNSAIKYIFKSINFANNFFVEVEEMSG